MNWQEFDVALFDLDGVITPTAEVHMRAWRQMLNEFLQGRGETKPYTDDDYFTYVDGKPRYDGVRSFLASRGIELPDGSPDDDPGADTVGGLGNRKNEVFSQVVATEGVAPYPGSVALLDYLAGTDLTLGIVSSSRNAPAVLRSAGLIDRFAFVVDGAVAQAEGLAGKPAPDTYLWGAQQAGATADRAVVIEDALSGVMAGAAGDFGLVIGVDRGAGADVLRDAGADLVVSDLQELVP